MELCVINFDEYTRELIEFWAKFCRILQGLSSHFLNDVCIYDEFRKEKSSTFGSS